MFQVEMNMRAVVQGVDFTLPWVMAQKFGLPAAQSIRMTGLEPEGRSSSLPIVVEFFAGQGRIEIFGWFKRY